MANGYIALFPTYSPVLNDLPREEPFYYGVPHLWYNAAEIAVLGCIQASRHGLLKKRSQKGVHCVAVTPGHVLLESRRSIHKPAAGDVHEERVGRS